MQSLKGIKVVEFAAFAAGPVVGKHLADHGATVVHIESQVRPDGFRAHYPPYKDNVHGLNRSGLFSLCNNDKLDITLNLKKAPAATVLDTQIVEISGLAAPCSWSGVSTRRDEAMTAQVTVRSSQTNHDPGAPR